MKDPVRDKLKRFELMEPIGSEKFNPTVGSAVDDYLSESDTALNESRPGRQQS